MADEDMATSEELEEQELTDEEKEQAKLKEAIEVQTEEVGTLRKKLTIKVPSTVIEEQRSDQYQEIKRDSVVPGFRRGHAPLRLVEKRFGSDVNEQLSAQLLSNSFLAAVEKEDLKTIGDPLLWAKDPKAGDEATEKLVSVDEAFDLITLPKEGDFVYSCEVEVRPEFELPDLEGIAIEQPKIEMDKAQVNEQIDRLRAIRGQYQPMPDSKIQEDDLVVCKLKVTAEGKTVLEEDNAQLAARPQRYAGILMEELGNKLKGAKLGDKKTLEGQFSDDYEDDSLRGKSASVEMEVQDIKRLVLPEIDEQFLSALGCDSRSELEDWVRSSLEAQRDDEIRRSERTQVKQYLLANTELELPEGLSQRQADRIAGRHVLELSRRGVPESEIMKQVDQIKTGARQEAIDDLKLNFIFEKIGEEWEVEASEGEINNQIAVIAQQQNRRFDRVRDDLIRNKTMPILYVQVRDEKIIDQILEKAEISEPASDKK